MLNELRDKARAAGVLSWKAGDGSDGDALAGAFPGTWWATFKGKQCGPYPDEQTALSSGLKQINL